MSWGTLQQRLRVCVLGEGVTSPLRGAAGLPQLGRAASAGCSGAQVGGTAGGERWGGDPGAGREPGGKGALHPGEPALSPWLI